MRTFLPLALVLALPALALIAVTAPPGCRLQVIPDYTVGFAYKAVLRPSPGCPAGQTLRVRKSSTTSVKRDGAPYQPIKPIRGAWDVGVQSTVPERELWTVNSWRWEYYDADAWSTRLQQKGRWIAAEVLRAGP